MNLNRYQLAAQHLVTAREARVPGDRIPAAWRPANIESALSIQRCVRSLLGLQIGGWKCALPTPGKINAAPIYLSALHSASPCPVVPLANVLRVEPEIAYLLREDLPPCNAPYSESRIREAVGEVRLVVEIIGSRYADSAKCTYFEMLADNLQNQSLFIGPVVENGLDRELEAFPFSVSTPTEVVHARHAKYPNGHPLNPLCWLVNFLATRGKGLQAGQIVTTGSYAGVVEVPLGTLLQFNFGNLGSLSVIFSPE